MNTTPNTETLAERASQDSPSPLASRQAIEELEELDGEWELVPESECDDQDDYPSDDQIRADLAGWVQEQEAWERGEGTLQVSIIDSDGAYIALQPMTYAEMEALKVSDTTIHETENDPHSVLRSQPTVAA